MKAGIKLKLTKVREKFLHSGMKNTNYIQMYGHVADHSQANFIKFCKLKI